MRRQTRTPQRWLIADGSLPVRPPRDVGVLLLRDLPTSQRSIILKSLRRAGTVVADEARGDAERVHNAGELRRALLRRTPLILLSPLFSTRSHPDWAPMPRMRAATLARLAGRRLIALGGMDDQRFAVIAPLGFVGWAGISAWMRLKSLKSRG